MRNPWLALEAGADATQRAGQLRRAHERFLTGGPIAAPVREVVADSWRRCAGARLGPESMARVEVDDAGLAVRRATHPLAHAMPVFRELLGTIADDGAHLLSVCDERGTMLWVEGHRQVLRRAERMNFVPGSQWAERASGTNAPGTALAVDHAVQIFAAEHYCRPVQSWTCAAAPVHDPHTGRVIGAVDLTGGDHLASPHSLALVQATARAAEARLAALEPEPTTRGTPPPRNGCTLAVLGRDEALLHTRAARGGGGPLRLGRRHSEILLLLAAHPDGLSGEELARELYGERDVNPVTLRAELSRLRHLLGPLLASRPYRLRDRPHTDYDTVADALAADDPAAALDAYSGLPLPGSQAPGVVRLRRLMEQRLRRRLLARPEARLLESWLCTAEGEQDLEVWEALHAVRPTPHTAIRVAELRKSYGLLPPEPPSLRTGERRATYPQRSRN
ncbi:helix-turn-helix domain-containing protein [Streptomyces spirodelae]|uniref:GAF domain-containing protein n=1 Tax=Streptomyces spirodelae TaxID=2812904 RepID=A0ABS3WM99_9ACTN|nr:helix-turn-helix domain-containing protein [Streptomyces spirodelae]MBO8184244.1 GAF domain-containing protein [Streptomyces spirodelae]